MKRITIIILILILTPIPAFPSDVDYSELLNKVDVSHPFYGNRIFGRDKVNVFQSRDKAIILIYQARYGGDGDHSENLLKLFKFHGNKGKKLLDQNIDSVEFIQENDSLKCIKGKYVATLCHVCDGWEVSEPDDIFFIPIIIDVESLTVKSTLNEKEKTELITRLEQQTDKNLAEQLSYGYRKSPAFAEPFYFGDSRYIEFVSKVKEQIKKLLGQK